MVDGSMNLSMSPDTNRSDGGNLRRFSMGKASSLSIHDQSSSRERRSSIGSCHDLCKYGHKHSTETKARVPLLKSAMKKSLDGQNSDLIVAVPEKEKQSVRGTKSKASSNLGTCITGGTDVVTRVVPINSPGRQSQVETKATSESKEGIVLENSPSRQSPIKIEVMSESEELVVPVNSPSRQSIIVIETTSESKERVVPNNSSSGKTSVASKNKELVLPVNSPTKQTPVEIQVKSKSKEQLVPRNSPSRRDRGEIGVTSESKERVVSENSPSRLRVEIGVKGERKEQVVPDPSRQGQVEIGVTSESKELVVPKSSPSRQSPYRRSPLKSEVMNESKELVAKTKSMPKTKKPNISIESESSPKQGLTNAGEAGSVNLLKPKALKPKSMTSSGSSGSITVQRNNSSKSGEGAGTSKGIETKLMGNLIVSSDPISVDAVGNLPAIKNKNSKVVSRVLSQNKTRRVQTKEAPSVETQETTLYVTNTETKKTNKLVESEQTKKHGLKGYPKSPSSLANGTSLSSHKEDRGGSGTKYSRSESNAKFLGPKKKSGTKREDDYNDHEIKKGRTPRMVQTKGKDSSSLSFSFRNRKVVDLHSESHSPMRLKFMRGKSIGDNQKSKDSHRTSLKKGIVKGTSKNSTPPSEKVVLRHQDVEGKKDSQVLFNNVIAETARKLVRARKSKVKALVGAFEKVISLQDKKPSVRATS